jgi:hypothetical protein
LRRAAELLDDFDVDFIGFDVAALRRSLGTCRERLEELGASDITRFDTTAIPRLELL